MTTKEKIEELTVILIALGLKPQLQYPESQTSQILNLSPATLWRMRKEGIGPEYKKRKTTSKSNNGRVMYPISSIADYYFDNIRTA
jgi:tryptophanyl-tRNA synthetase